jgi:hypothetical protein
MGVSGLSKEDLPSMWVDTIQLAGGLGRTERQRKGKFTHSLLELGHPSSGLRHQNSRFSIMWTLEHTSGLRFLRLWTSWRVIPSVSLVLRLKDLNLASLRAFLDLQHADRPLWDFLASTFA